MTIPDFQTLMKPFLKTIENGNTYHLNEITEKLAIEFNLSAEDLKIKVPSGQQLLFRNRVTWTASHLKKAGLITSNGNGVYSITAKGKDVLNDSAIPTINLAFLKTLDPFKEWESTFGAKKTAKAGRTVINADITNETPDIIIGNEIQKLEQSLKYDLLEMIKEKDPAFFEFFVLELLSKMGYGGTEEDDFEVVGKSSDGGIDGIIYQDSYGLTKFMYRPKDGRIIKWHLKIFVILLAL